MHPWSTITAAIEKQLTHLGWSSTDKKKLRGPDDGRSDMIWRGQAHGRPFLIQALGPDVHDSAFIRIEIGEGKRTFWSVAQNDVSRVAFQAAAGSDLIALGTGFWVDREAEDTAREVVEGLMEIADRAIRDGRGIRQPLVMEALEAAQPTSEKAAIWGKGLGVSGVALAATAALAIIEPPLGIMIGQYTAPVVLGAAAYIAAKLRLSPLPKRCDALSKILRASRLFDEVERPRAATPLRPAVLFAGFRALGRARFRTGIIQAHSTTTELELSIVVRSLDSRSEIHPSCRIVPDEWATVEVRGPDDRLIRLTAREGVEREPGLARWYFTDQDLQEGALEQLLSDLEASLAARGGPFR